MGLLRRLFFSKSDLPALRKAVSTQRYADALLIAEELRESELGSVEHAELETLAAQAGDSLARKNLNEGLYLVQEQQWEGAAEHLTLAQQQSVSADLKQEVEHALHRLQLEKAAASSAVLSPSSSSCSSCAPALSETSVSVSALDSPDFDAQLELILTSYPEELVGRYQQKSPEFLQAFVLGHQGEEVEAMKKFGLLPASEQDDLFDFEVGCLMARLGERPKACDALYSALQQNSTLLLATEAMVSILLSLKEHQKALSFMQEMMAKDQPPAFCHAQLATIYHAMDDADNALHHGSKALESGHAETHIVLMTAMLHEGKQQLNEAEVLYRKIPAPASCGAVGMNLYLAEFLLRQKRELRKVLDTFNSACRNEPENPRWQLRVAQTYLGLGWEKRGQKLLKLVVRDPNLMEALRSEAKAMLVE